MTGRWLYDKFTDSYAAKSRKFLPGEGWVPAGPLLAWPFLSDKERAVWNDLAARIRPKRKKQ